MTALGVIQLKAFLRFILWSAIIAMLIFAIFIWRGRGKSDTATQCTSIDSQGKGHPEGCYFTDALPDPKQSDTAKGTSEFARNVFSGHGMCSDDNRNWWPERSPGKCFAEDKEKGPLWNASTAQFISHEHLNDAVIRGEAYGLCLDPLVNKKWATVCADIARRYAENSDGVWPK